MAYNDVDLEDIYLLESIEDFFSGNMPMQISSVRASGMAVGARTRRRMYRRRIREQFKIPEHIPFVQFKRYLRELERRIKCQLNKI